MADALYHSLKAMIAPVADVYFRLHASGHELLPPGPFILAANHSSLLDWVFVARFVARPVRFVLSRDFYDQPAFTWAYRRLGVIPIRERMIESGLEPRVMSTDSQFSRSRIRRAACAMPSSVSSSVFVRRRAS